MKQKNDKVKKIKQILNDKLYYNEYYGGLFIEFDTPFYILPILTLYYKFDDISHVITEKYLDKVNVYSDKVKYKDIDVTCIKFKPIEINNIGEFSKVQTEFLDLILELANDLPENPVWTKFTFPSDKSTKISCTTIN